MNVKGDECLEEDKIVIGKTRKERSDKDNSYRLHTRINSVLHDLNSEIIKKSGKRLTHREILTRALLLLPYHNINECVKIIKSLEFKEKAILNPNDPKQDAGIKYDPAIDKWFVVTEYLNGKKIISKPFKQHSDACAFLKDKNKLNIQRKKDITKLAAQEQRDKIASKKNRIYEINEIERVANTINISKYNSDDNYMSDEMKLIKNMENDSDQSYIDEDEEAMLNYDPEKI